MESVFTAKRDLRPILVMRPCAAGRWHNSGMLVERNRLSLLIYNLWHLKTNVLLLGSEEKSSPGKSI